MPRESRAVWMAYSLWLVHNAEETFTGFCDFLKGGHFFGMFVGTRHAAEWMTVCFEVSTAGLLWVLLGRRGRLARCLVAAIVMFIPIGAIHHLLFWTPGVTTAVLLGFPSVAYALWHMRRSGLSRGELAVALAGAAAAYVPLGVLQSATGVWLDRTIPLPDDVAACALWAIVTLGCAAVALLGSRRANHRTSDHNGNRRTIDKNDKVDRNDKTDKPSATVAVTA